MIAEPREPPLIVLLTATVQIEDHKGELRPYTLHRDEHPTYLAYHVRVDGGPRGGEHYECRQTAGEQRCTCGDCKYRKRVCKHLWVLQDLGVFRRQEELLLAVTTPVTAPVEEPDADDSDIPF